MRLCSALEGLPSVKARNFQQSHFNAGKRRYSADYPLVQEQSKSLFCYKALLNYDYFINTSIAPFFAYKRECILRHGLGIYRNEGLHIVNSTIRERFAESGSSVVRFPIYRDAHNQCNRNRPIEFDSCKIAPCDSD